MKKILFFILLFLFLIKYDVYSSEDYSFGNISVNVSTAPTPIFFVQNVSNNMSMNSQNRWVLIEVSYNFNVNNSLNFKPSVNPASDLTNNFTINADALIAGQNCFYLLSNSANYSAVTLNGSTKYALFLIPPQIIGKIIPPKKNLNNSYLKNALQIKITFLKNNKISNIFYYPKNNSTEQAFKNLNNDRVSQIPNGLLNRMQTPWAIINFDKYELMSSNN